jgi:hypothetical protein
MTQYSLLWLRLKTFCIKNIYNMLPETYLKEIFVEKGLTFCKGDHLKLPTGLQKWLSKFVNIYTMAKYLWSKLLLAPCLTR